MTTLILWFFIVNLICGIVGLIIDCKRQLKLQDKALDVLAGMAWSIPHFRDLYNHDFGWEKKEDVIRGVLDRARKEMEK